jgi:hypothetical protein
MTFHDHSVIFLDQRKMRVFAGYDEPPGMGLLLSMKAQFFKMAKLRC